MNDVRKWDCNKEAKPVDSTAWGNATYMKTPATSYNMTFQDPRKIIEEQEKLQKLFKEAETEYDKNGINLVDKAIMMGYLDQNEKVSEDTESVGS